MRGEFLHCLAENACAGGAERVTEGNASAVRIDALARERAELRIDADLVAQERPVLQGLEVEEGLRGERFMNFPQLDVLIGQPLPRQQSRDRKGGRHEQPLDAKVHRGDFPIDQPHPRNRRRQPLDTFAGGHPDGATSDIDGGQQLVEG